MSEVQKWDNAKEIRDTIAETLREQGAQWPRYGAKLVMSDLAKAGFEIKREKE